MDLLEDDYGFGDNALECYKSVLIGGAYEPLEKALLSKCEVSAVSGRDSEGGRYKRLLSELRSVAGKGRKGQDLAGAICEHCDSVGKLLLDGRERYACEGCPEINGQ